MKKTIILGLYLVALSFAAWSQTDIIPITGTAIDTTKVYDGTTAVNIITLGEIPLLPYNQVTINAEAHYLDANVGEDKPVVVTFSLSGDDAYHYQTPASITLYADITPLNITAEGLQLQHTREYNGTTSCDILSVGDLQGVLPDDTVEQTVTAHFVSPSAGYFKPISVTHTLNGPQAMNYTVTDSSFYMGNILRRTVTPSRVYVYYNKEYDGTDTARIGFQPHLDNIIADDDISVHLTANFDSPEIGDNKIIYLHYQLLGADTGNYTIQADSIYSYDGRIIPVLILDSTEGGQPFVSTAYGYCNREVVSFRYHILQGELAYYRVSFSDEARAAGFNDVPQTYTSDTVGTVQFLVINAPAGRYDATIEFYSAGHVLRQFPVSFIINLPNDYLTMPFDDVISIDNSGSLDGQPNRFRTFQWYHNDEAILNANQPYYQELGGLTGKYAVMVNLGADDEAMVCPTQINTTGKTSITLMPSPVVTSTTVRLQGFEETLHQLYVYNSHGIVVFSTTFESSQYRLDLSTLPQGTYMVTVDGLSTKTLKL